MRTVAKIAATLGVVGAIAVGSAAPAEAWYGYHHRYYHHHAYYPYYHRHYYAYYPYYPYYHHHYRPPSLLAPLVLARSFFSTASLWRTSDCGASDKAGPAVRHVSRDLRASLRVREHNHANTPVPRQSSI